MGTSYPRRDSASGVWRVTDIADNLQKYGSFPTATRAIFAGGKTPSASDIIDYIAIEAAGDAVDFGDLAAATTHTSGLGSFSRSVIGGGYAGGNIDVIQYVTPTSTGNAADFGDLLAVKTELSACSNSTRGVFMPGNPATAVIE